MTKSEWQSCNDPIAMLKWLRDQGKLSERKARLFAVACCRLVWDFLTDDDCKKAVHVAERFADGLADKGDLRAARRGAMSANFTGPRDECAHRAAIATTSDNAFDAAHAGHQDVVSALARGTFTGAYFVTRPGPRESTRSRNEAFRTISDVLRDLCNPFRTPSSFTVTEKVLHLATQIYEGASFERLSELAEQLAAGGCDDEDLLAHLRSPGPHHRGFWALDEVLGKE
jgi:hypothetical protein